MFFLNVPYAEKDHARQLGARWDAGSKKWYVPSGTLATPFECWMSASAVVTLRAKKASTSSGNAHANPRKAARKRVDASGGRITVGVNYVPQVGAVGPPWDV